MFEIKCISALEKIFPDGQPLCGLNYGSCLKNERFSFQLAVKSGEALNLKLSLPEDMWDNLDVCRVESVPCRKTGNGKLDDDYVLISDRKATWYPDVLLPSSLKFEILANQWTAVYITAHDLPAGQNEIEISVLKDSDGETLGKTSFTVKVIDAEMEELPIPFATWMHYDCLSHWYKAKPFSSKFNEICGKYMENAVKYGINTLYVPLFTPPLDTEPGKYRKTVQLIDAYFNDGEFSFGFCKLEEFIKLGLEKGYRYFELSHLATQWGAEYCPGIMVETNGKKRRMFGWKTESTSEKYVKFLTKLLPELCSFLDRMGLKGRCFFHVSDEPSEENLPIYAKICGIIKGLTKGYPIIETLSDYTFMRYNLIDTPISPTERAVDFINAKIGSWVYYCCGQSFNYLSNRFLNMPLLRTRIIGIQLYLNDACGFLHWGYNFWNSQFSKRAVNPYFETDADQKFPGGDAFIVYPSKDGPINSLRIDAIYQGICDYRALKLLEKKYSKKYVMDLLKENMVEGYTVYPRSENWLMGFREKINGLLAE